MPRMTRTQKYANLREQLANGKEENTTSSELSPFQNRLNNLQGALNPSFSGLDNQNISSHEENTFEETPIETVESQNQDINTQETVSENNTELVNPDINNQEPPVDNKSEPQEAVINNQEESLNNSGSSYFDDFVEVEVEQQSQANDFNKYFNNDASIDEKNEEVFEDVKDNNGEIIDKERDTYLNKALSDAKNYNINNGRQTVEQLVDDSVDEIRHPDDKEEKPNNDDQSDFNREEVSVDNNETIENEPEDNTYAWTPFTDDESESTPVENDLEEPVIDDEEFSNTVSLEISKIMDEIPPIQDEIDDTNNFKEEIIEEKIDENIPEYDETINETIKINETNDEEKIEDVVEIKNISEIEKEPIRDTFSSTIPFVVAANDEDIEDDIEEDKSNTVLNVILIILIVVLAAVLGLIIFYILKTKGIF